MLIQEDEWATYGMKEAPFWRDDITPIEYEIESAYYYGNGFCGTKNLEYEPLWKQKDWKSVSIEDNWVSPYFTGFEFWNNGMSVGDFIEKYNEYFKKLRNEKK